MKTQRFTRKPFDVDAVKVTDSNFHEVAAWCRGEVKQTSGHDAFSSKGRKRTYVKVFVIAPKHVRQTMAFEGDWVVYSGTGFKIYRDKAFLDTFEEVTDYDPNFKAEQTAVAKTLPSAINAVEDVVRNALHKQDASTYHGRSSDIKELAALTARQIVDLLVRGGDLKPMAGQVLARPKGLTTGVRIDEVAIVPSERILQPENTLRRLAVEGDNGEVIRPFENS